MGVSGGFRTHLRALRGILRAFTEVEGVSGSLKKVLKVLFWDVFRGLSDIPRHLRVSQVKSSRNNLLGFKGYNRIEGAFQNASWSFRDVFGRLKAS